MKRKVSSKSDTTHSRQRNGQLETARRRGNQISGLLITEIIDIGAVQTF